MNMKELTCSDNEKSRLTGSVGKKPNLENPVYSNNQSYVITGSIDNIPDTLELFSFKNLYSRPTGSISKKPTKGFTVVVNT